MTKLRLRSDNSRGLYCKLTPSVINKVKTLNLLGKNSVTVSLPTYFNPYKKSSKGITVIKSKGHFGNNNRKIRGRCNMGWKPGTRQGEPRQWTLWLENTLPF